MKLLPYYSLSCPPLKLSISFPICKWGTSTVCICTKALSLTGTFGCNCTEEEIVSKTTQKAENAKSLKENQVHLKLFVHAAFHHF